MPSPWLTPPEIAPPRISSRSAPAPNSTPATVPRIVPRLTSVPFAAPAKTTPTPANASMLPSFTTVPPAARTMPRPDWLLMRPDASLVTRAAVSRMLMPCPAPPSAVRVPRLTTTLSAPPLTRIALAPVPLAVMVPAFSSVFALPPSDSRPLAFAPVVVMVPAAVFDSRLRLPLVWRPSEVLPAVTMRPLFVTTLSLPCANTASSVLPAVSSIVPWLSTRLASRIRTPGPLAGASTAPGSKVTPTSRLSGAATTPVVAGFGADVSQTTRCPVVGARVLHAPHAMEGVAKAVNPSHPTMASERRSFLGSGMMGLLLPTMRCDRRRAEPGPLWPAPAARRADVVAPTMRYRVSKRVHAALTPHPRFWPGTGRHRPVRPSLKVKARRPWQGIPMRTALLALLVLYILCCLGALGLIVVSQKSLYGLAPDPLAAVFAIVLALPWSLALHGLPSLGASQALALLATGMALNLAIGIGLMRRWR
ncbi:hypothetical protein [Pseudoxanthomonas sp. CF385]|uniref:hypothetical protein n=1 Tax=Pseudoxanthomonas sp. CF385 TaxID=1881042 RepID=UPI001113ED2B|nr:hypothetical protein [Pseudoxanthomonas sp. CF385]